MFLDKVEDVVLLKKKRFACCVIDRDSSFLQRLIANEQFEYKKNKRMKICTKVGIICEDKLMNLEHSIEFIKTDVKNVGHWKQDFMLLLLAYI
jgi:hypothetical protein